MAIVNFYASTRAATGVSEKVIIGVSLGEVIDNAILEFPDLKSIILRCSFLVNQIASNNLAMDISDEDVIDILPQFAGGA